MHKEDVGWKAGKTRTHARTRWKVPLRTSFLSCRFPSRLYFVEVRSGGRRRHHPVFLSQKPKQNSSAESPPQTLPRSVATAVRPSPEAPPNTRACGGTVATKTTTTSRSRVARAAICSHRSRFGNKVLLFVVGLERILFVLR